jgi:hypothetical protein
MILSSIQFDPGYSIGGIAQMDLFAAQKLRADFKQPMSQSFSICIDPSPRNGQFSDHGEVLTCFFVPVRKSIAPESKDCLQGIAKHACGERLSRVTYQLVLPNRAILIFIHNKVPIARRKDIVYVARL